MKKIFIVIAMFIFLGCLEEKGLIVKLDFKEFPDKYTCNGLNISPKIEISGIDKKAKSIAIIMYDIDADFTHWLIWNIKAEEKLTIPEGIPKQRGIKEPIEAIQGKNDFGKIGYDGPCPPSGKHRYYFYVYVLDDFLDLNGGATKEELEKKMEGHIIQKGYAIATYGAKY